MSGATSNTDAPVSEEIAAKAEAIKNEANEKFQKGKYKEALELYDKAIELNPKVAIYYSNRAFAYIKLEQYGAAITDATTSIALDPKYAKGYYRRGSAHLALGKYKLGRKDFQKVVQLYPKNKEAQEKLKHCEKIVKKLQFEAAIGIEEVEVSSTINLDDFAVDSSYDGPHLPDPITPEFIKDLIAYLKKQKKLHAKYAYSILLQIKQQLKSLDSLITVEVPEGTHLTVCGDVHGQFYDLCNIFELNGLPSESNPYLFNGDFVDRGSFSVEVILTLFACKLMYPKHFHLLRGNHESLTINKLYGFEGEVIAKYSSKMFDLFTEVFCWLPLAAQIVGANGKKVLVLHGGLFSKEGVTLDDIKNIDRNRQPPEDGLMSELLWSDPSPFPGITPNKRGAGIAFGPDVTHKFLKHNNLEMLVRSHEVKEEGYLVEADGKLVTVFSAPNYCDQVGNKGAFIKFDSNLTPNYVSFTAVEHPPVKPMAYANNMGMFLS